MTRPTEGILLVLLGGVLLRMSLWGSYLNYVASWMRWPLLASALILLALALGAVFGRSPHTQDDHVHGRPPWATWLLVLPCLITFVVAPPALGSYLAERRANEVAPPAPAVVEDVRSGSDIPLPVTEFVWRAQDGGETLEDRSVRLTGFVSYGKSGEWFVTRLAISCCAADAVAFQVRAEGAESRPPRDQWVGVTGVYVEDSGVRARSTPAISVTRIEEIDAPSETYE